MRPTDLNRSVPSAVPGNPLVICDGMVYDGSGSPPRRGHVTLRGAEIVAVDDDRHDTGASVVNVDGLAVAPGFIDMHTHSDVSTLSDPDCVSAIQQGITTQVVGHCGFSAAPTDETTRRTLSEEEPIFGFPPGEHHGAAGWGWNTVADYLDAVRIARPRTNIATLAGHNTIRRLVLGSADRPADAVVTEQICAAVEAAIADGAMGVSTGLSYTPGLFARLDELVAVASVAGRHGHRYHTHMRYGDDGVRASLSEAIRTGQLSECPVNVSHLYPSRTDPPDEAERLLQMIDEANRHGADVTFDLTLFRRGGGAWVQTLPRWARKGGISATVRRLRDARAQSRLRGELNERCAERRWDDDLIVKVNRPTNSPLVGQTIGAIAEQRGVDPVSAALMLVEEDGQFWVAPTIKRQADLDVLLSHPACVPVTDGMCAHPARHAHLGLMPKTFGTFPLLLGEYVRRRGVLTLAEAIARITSMPADRVGLRHRGRLAAGNRADIVVFDPETVGNRATDDRPAARPVGIQHVLVNGTWAIRDGELTPDRSGEALTCS